MVIGPADSALGYARLARQLEATGRYEALVSGWSSLMEAIALVETGDSECGLRIFRDLAASKTSVSSRALGSDGLLYFLPGLGMADEAALHADDAVEAAKVWRFPVMIAASTGGYGSTAAAIDPPRALAALRSGLEYSRQHRVRYWEIYISYELAVVEADSGDLGQALDLFDVSINSWQRAGDRFNLARGLASLAMCFARLHVLEPAAIIYGASTRLLGAAPVAGLAQAVEQLRVNLGATAVDRCVATATAMETGDAVAYARKQIRLVRDSTQQSA
jgi:hypothetical protein